MRRMMSGPRSLPKVSFANDGVICLTVAALYINSDKELSFNSSKYNVSAIYTGKESVPAGPYFVHRYTGNVFQAYRLYVDTNQAFIQVCSPLMHSTSLTATVYIPRPLWNPPSPSRRHPLRRRSHDCRSIPSLLHTHERKASRRSSSRC
jgi:hypothetical protein